MARRRGSSASFGGPSKSPLTSRRFDASISQLTEESIEQSLREIEKALQDRYGRHAPTRKGSKAEKT